MLVVVFVPSELRKVLRVKSNLQAQPNNQTINFTTVGTKIKQTKKCLVCDSPNTDQTAPAGRLLHFKQTHCVKMKGGPKHSKEKHPLPEKKSTFDIVKAKITSFYLHVGKQLDQLCPQSMTKMFKTLGKQQLFIVDSLKNSKHNIVFPRYMYGASIIKKQLGKK